MYLFYFWLLIKTHIHSYETQNHEQTCLLRPNTQRTPNEVCPLLLLLPLPPPLLLPLPIFKCLFNSQLDLFQVSLGPPKGKELLAHDFLQAMLLVSPVIVVNALNGNIAKHSQSQCTYHTAIKPCTHAYIFHVLSVVLTRVLHGILC